MKKFLAKFWILAILIAFPLIRHHNTNATVDALMEWGVWLTLIVIFLFSLLMVACAITAHAWPEKMKVENVSDICKTSTVYMVIRTILTVGTVLGVFIYTEWAGPAVMYSIVSILLHSSVVAIRRAFRKMAHEETNT